MTNNQPPHYLESRSPKSPRNFTYDAPRSTKFDYDTPLLEHYHHPQQQQQQEQQPQQHIHQPPTPTLYHHQSVQIQQQYSAPKPYSSPAPRSPKITYSNNDAPDFYEMHAYQYGGGNTSYMGGGIGGYNGGEGMPSATYDVVGRSPKAANKFLFDSVSPRDEPQISK